MTEGRVAGSGGAGAGPVPSGRSGSGTRAAPGRRRRRSLTWRVSAFVAIIVSAALLVMVGVSGLVMTRWMTSSVDSDLQQNLMRMSDRRGGAPTPDRSAPSGGPMSGLGQDGVPSDLRGPGAGQGSLRLVSSGGQVQAGVVVDYEIVQLSEDSQAELLSVAADGRGHTVRLEDVGVFRVAAEDTDTGRVVVGQSLEDMTGTITTLVWVEGVLAVVLAVAVAVAGFGWVRREMRPLARVASTARHIGARDLQSRDIEPFDRVDRADARPGTEVGDVGLALNAMIDNVESALHVRATSERQLRQFVADASHELRTPLASIQGYTQLLQKDSVDTDLALSRITSESQRMSGLVEDMLLLARLDAGRELEAVPVDVVPLVVDALSDAHAAGPGHLWSLDIDEDAAASCVVIGDEAGMRQILANLLANARIHTPEGTHVVVGAHAGTGEVRISVADDGPGIPEEVRPIVFNRFVRGDTSRTRSGTGSSGLGLSIVSSLAQAMGGRVDLNTSEDGTTFTVVLPQFRE